MYDFLIVCNNINGMEDKFVGDWLKSVGKVKNCVSKKFFFYDYLEFGGKCVYDFIFEIILIY